MRVSSIAVRRRASFGILCAFVAVLILIPGSRSVAAANEPRAGRQPVKSQEAKASEPEPACTEAVASLGLCAAKPVQKKEPETAAAVEAVIKRPQTTGTGNAGAQEPPCTEAVAALGLCTPKPTQRRE